MLDEFNDEDEDEDEEDDDAGVGLPRVDLVFEGLGLTLRGSGKRVLGGASGAIGAGLLRPRPCAHQCANHISRERPSSLVDGHTGTSAARFLSGPALLVFAVAAAGDGTGTRPWRGGRRRRRS